LGVKSAAKKPLVQAVQKVQTVQVVERGTGDIDATAIMKNAPHPNTALLFARWSRSE